MRVHAVMAEFSGNDRVQFVELRMNADSQTLLSGHKLRFLDGSGVEQAEFTFPSNVANGLRGDSILIATQEFDTSYTPGGNADFVFSTANTTGTSTNIRQHPVQRPNGKVIFEPAATGCSLSGPPVDSVAYGSGAVTGDWGGGAKAVALPPLTTNQGLRLGNLALIPTNNSSEYTLQSPSSTTVAIPGTTMDLETDLRFPRTNGRTLLQVGPVGVGGTVVEPEVAEAQASSAADGQSGKTTTVLGAAIVAFVTAAGGALYLKRRRRV
jgi:hypothetical protein